MNSLVTSLDATPAKGLLKNVTPDGLQGLLQGYRITSIKRTGKWIAFHLDQSVYSPGWVLLSHLGMFGSWRLQPSKPLAPDPHTRLILQLSQGAEQPELTYTDVRNWGRIHLFAPEDARKFLLSRIGPDALEVPLHYMTNLMGLDRRMVCVSLLDQTFVAGIGNIYRSEILWSARIDPGRPSCDLTPQEISTIRSEMQRILRLAIEQRGCTVQSYRGSDGKSGNFQKHLNVYGRAGRICHRCQAFLRETVVWDGRKVFYCNFCQV